MTSRHHTVLATLLVLGGLFVMRLASVEIQPYPEGLYALRGLSIQQTMQWLDQAAIAPGGMYSAMMPPLPAWTAAIGIDIVGPTPLAVRWFSVVCSLLIILLTYAVARRVVSYESSIIAMVVVGTSIPLIVLGRQADALVPFVTAALAMVWASATLSDVAGGVHRVVRSLVLAVAVAMGILSAPIATLMIVLLCALFIRSSAARWWIGGGVVAGAAMGLPWWIAMASRYGDQVFLAWSLPIPSTAVASGGVLSPLTYLVLSSPLLVVALMWVVVVLRDRSLLVSRDRPEIAVLGLWFVGGMLALAMSQQRMIAHALVFIPPAAILAMSALERIRRDATSRRMLVSYTLIALATVWFVGEALIQDRLNLQTVVLGLAIGMLAIVVLLKQLRTRGGKDGAAVRLYQPIIYGALAAAALIAIVRVVRPGPTAITGGRQVARLLLDDSLFHRSFAYVFHNASETDAVNGQLEWYTQGWMSGTKRGFTHMAIALPADGSDNATLAVARLLPWIVYYHPQGQRTLTTDVRDALLTTHVVTYDTQHYTLLKMR